MFNTFTKVFGMFIVGILMNLSLTGCGSSSTTNIPTEPTPPVETVTLTEIQVSPSVESIAIGINVQYNAIGIYSDGTNADITADVTWESSDAAVATVDTVGLANTLTVGSTTVTASLEEISGLSLIHI